MKERAAVMDALDIYVSEFLEAREAIDKKYIAAYYTKNRWKYSVN